MEDDHAQDVGHKVVRDESVIEDAPDRKATSHETTADDTIKDSHDENGEDVIEEAAEDTVIY
jgi:hypothetical protein